MFGRYDSKLVHGAQCCTIAPYLFAKSSRHEAIGVRLVEMHAMRANIHAALRLVP